MWCWQFRFAQPNGVRHRKQQEFGMVPFQCREPFDSRHKKTASVGGVRVLVRVGYLPAVPAFRMWAAGVDREQDPATSAHALVMAQGRPVREGAGAEGGRVHD